VTELTELVDIDPSRQDGVLSPASGFPILMMKSIDPSQESPVSETETPKDAEVEPEAPETPVEKTSETETPQPEAQPDTAALIKEAVAEAMQSHEAALKAVRDELAKVMATPLPGGPGLARAPQFGAPAPGRPGDDRAAADACPARPGRPSQQGP
jgi:hypothetical protein